MQHQAVLIALQHQLGQVDLQDLIRAELNGSNARGVAGQRAEQDVEVDEIRLQYVARVVARAQVQRAARDEGAAARAETVFDLANRLQVQVEARARFRAHIC